MGQREVLQEQLWFPRDAKLCFSFPVFLTPAPHSFPEHCQWCHLLTWQMGETLKTTSAFLSLCGLFLSHVDLEDTFCKSLACIFTPLVKHSEWGMHTQFGKLYFPRNGSERQKFSRTGAFSCKTWSLSLIIIKKMWSRGNYRILRTSLPSLLQGLV